MRSCERGCGTVTYRAGTLIEVLVSLVIVTLVLLTMLDVSVHKRQAASNAIRSRETLKLAITWQSARLARADWTQGEAGYFPDPVEARWMVEQVNDAQISGSGFSPDAQWQTLRVMRSNDDPGAAFLVRIDMPPDVSSSEEIR